jgi:hypothetical protein
MPYSRAVVSVLVLLLASVAFTAQAEDTKSAKTSEKIPKGAKVYIAPISDGFDTYLKTALSDKKVPVQVVDSREKADYQIDGVSDTQKASTAKKVIMGNWHSREEASIRVSNIQSGEVVWSYSVHKEASAHGKRSTAEACAKHLKDAIAEN